MAETPATLSDWIRLMLGPQGSWRRLYGDAAWFYDKLEEAIPKAEALEGQLTACKRALHRAERRCDPCGLTLAECMDARRAGKLACCPECNHPTLPPDGSEPSASDRHDKARRTCDPEILFYVAVGVAFLLGVLAHALARGW